MKRLFFFTGILIFLLPALFSLDNNILSIKLTGEVNLTNGMINEYVFDKACKNTDHKASQLDWDVKSIPVFKGKAELNLLKFLHTEICGSVAVPKASGNMQDYDWLNSYYWPYDDPTERTNYSIHDNELVKYLTFSAGLGANIKLPAEITLTPMAAYYYEFISFDGKNGYKSYKSDNWEEFEFEGKVISYKQEMNDFLLGLAIRVETLPMMFFYADFFISPQSLSLTAVDYHYTNQITYGTAFLDQFKNIWQLQAKTAAQYVFNKYHRAGLSASIQYIPTSYGTNKERYITSDGEFFPNSSWRTTDITSGTGRFLWNIGLNYSFSL